MKIIQEFDKNGPILFSPDVHDDERGYFFESYNERRFNDLMGTDINFVQDNESKSSYGVVRGMHCQTGYSEQAKLVRVVKGSVIDVVVDNRPDSPNYKKVYHIELSDENHYLFFVPKGFLHGFIATGEGENVFQYKCDNFYDKESELGYRWNSIDFDWEGESCVKLEDIIVSEKDGNLPPYV